MTISCVFLLMAFWNPFSIFTAHKVPPCDGVKATCVALTGVTSHVATGVARPIAAVYYQGKSIPFTVSDEKSLGPVAVSIPLNKITNQPELLTLKYAPVDSAASVMAKAKKKTAPATQGTDARMQLPKSSENKASENKTIENSGSQ